MTLPERIVCAGLALLCVGLAATVHGTFTVLLGAMALALFISAIRT